MLVQAQRVTQRTGQKPILEEGGKHMEYTPEGAAKVAVEELYEKNGWDVESVGPSMQEIIDLFQPYIDHAYLMGLKWGKKK